MDQPQPPEQHPAYHLPVMLFECLDALHIKPNGTYVDVTFGGGGHSKAILEHLGPEGKLIAFDQDPDARKNLPDPSDQRLTLVPANFRYIAHFLRYVNAPQVDGILADLGVSSYQFDTGERGFSYRFDGPLDMRMNTETGEDAASLLNRLPEKELTHLFRSYGELNMAHKLARQIAEVRQHRPLKTIGDLLDAIEPLLPTRERYSLLSRVFQAIRMEVNQEMAALREFLEATPRCLKPNGRLVILSYHSLEDRLVKRFLRSGDPDGQEKRDEKGRLMRPLDPLQDKAPSSHEIETNPRARSARLRVGIKNTESGQR